MNTTNSGITRDTGSERQGLPRRLLMLGLDAFSLPYVRENLGELPVLARLLRSGRLVEMDTPARVVSASVWASFSAGGGPGVHGQYFPLQWIGDQMRFARIERGEISKRFAYEPFWYNIARQGRRVVVLDVGNTFLHENSPCTEIINWSYQSSAYAAATDPELLKTLRRRFGHRPIGPEVPVPKNRPLSEKLKRRWLCSLGHKFDAIEWLMEARDWELFIAGIYEFHRAGHNLWPGGESLDTEVPADALLDLYREGDVRLGRLLDSVDLDTTGVVLFALHGMAPNRAQNHFMEEILAGLNTIYRGGVARHDQAPGNRSFAATLRHRVPYGLQYTAAGILGEGVKDWVVSRELVGGRNWKETPSFWCASGGEGYIRLNVKGREREGCLEAADCEAYVDWLTDKLLEIQVADTGEPLIDEVVRLADEFPGPRAHLLPDLATVWSPEAPVRAVLSPDLGRIEKRLTTGRGGNHTADSFALFCGTIPVGFEPSSLRSVTDYARVVSELL